MYSFYLNKELERWRIMLYDNINVFLKHSWFNIVEGYEDIVWDVVLEIDKRIQESIEKWYKEWQVYSFIKFKLRWYLMNKYNRKDSMTYFKSYSDDFIEWIEWNLEGWEIELIKEFVMEMEDPERVVILLKHFSESSFSLDKIAKHIERSISDTSKIYKYWLSILKWFLNNVPLEDESTNTSKSKTNIKKW